MKITDLEIDGFGVWSGLRIDKMSESINVLYGPNEAGKTTLLQFIRSMFYGFAPARRKYLPPVHGGEPGGTLSVAGPHGRFEIGRHQDASAGGAFGDRVTLTAPDGARQGEHFIKVLLSNVDEPVFNNVFAVGLQEIQELATLSDTEAAELLYSLSAGLDRVSLVEVLHELHASRNRILDAEGRPCLVVQLLEEREKIRGEIEELGSIQRRWAHFAAEQKDLGQEITQLEEDANRAENTARSVELALALRDRWGQRAALNEQLSALGPQAAVPDDGLQRLDAVNAKIERHQQRIEHLARLREHAKREFASLAVNEALWRQAARIEAMKEQESWIAQLQGQIGELQGEIDALQSQSAAERERLGLKSDASHELPPAIPARMLASLRSPAKLLQQSHARLKESLQAVETSRQNAESLQSKIASELSARGASDLAAAMDRAGGLVSQYRRRVQLDERLEQLARYQVELEDRSKRLMDRQLLPVGALIGIGAILVPSIMLVLVGLFFPASLVGSIGWPAALLGLAGCAVAVTVKIMLERSNRQQLEGCQKQLSVLQLQIQQAKEDRDQIDAQLPRGGGMIAGRLQAAERELASLEELTPLDTRRSAAWQEVEATGRRADEAKEEYQNARRRWRDALRAAGLPDDFRPDQVRQLIQRGDRIGEIQRRLVQRRDDLTRRQRELESLASRIVQLAADAGVSLGATDPVEQLRELAAAAAQQQAAAARREALRNHARRIRAKRAKHEEAIVSQKHRRRALFLEAGVQDEQEYRRRVEEYAKSEVLRRERDAIAHEIETVLASQCSEESIARLLDAEQAVPLETRREELRQRLAAQQQLLRQRLEQRGRLSEQLAALANDRQLAAKHLELAVVEKRLRDAIHRWQVLAVTCALLDMIRDTYEQHRQPETLQEASGYLNRLTQGRYRRVWTPLGEHALRVDDAEGHALPVEVLSRGTREQLFLSLRLALANSYVRRGAPLPLVLDDVLVNFDSERAKAAATVLRDFAEAGHQLLVFTCHEHIAKLFQSLKVSVSRLPSNAEPGKMVITMEQHAEEPEEDRPARRKPAARKKSAPPHEKDEERPEKKPKAKKPHKSSGTFDADFFDSEEESDDEEDLLEGDELNDDEINDASWADEEGEATEDVDDDDDDIVAA